MPQTINEIMTKDPVRLASSTSLAEAARRMRESAIGDVLVMEADELCGVVTDRDIVVRAVAEGRDVQSTTLGEVCSEDVVTLEPSAPVSAAVRLMSDQAIRRLPVVDDGRPVGIVAIGDLAMERDPNSALADISAAAPNT